ncbi:MAG: hypothetical protein HDR71_12345 [Lachnospiraceae bacterium]|nr:hypothetical protein [Lachnospiraceae bacterium]
MEIYILDRDINILGIISTYEAIIWNPKFYEPGIFKAEFVYTEKMNAILQIENLLYKTDEDEPAIITRRFAKLNRNGEEVIQVQGYMASRYLNRRIIWEKMILKGSPEEAMREMVYRQVIDPLDPARKISHIRLGELSGYGGNIEKQITYDNLQEALTDIGKTSELGYRLRLDINQKLFLFEVLQGTDRTVGTEHPCVFTRDYGNVLTQEYSEDNTNYRNICLVGGSGEDADRILVTAGEAEGLDRYEMFYNASGMTNRDIEDKKYQGQLKQKGTERLAANYMAKAFESKINKKKAMKFELGDYVTCMDRRWNITVNTQVKEIEKGLSKKEESFFVTFGDSAPTLINLIKARG